MAARRCLAHDRPWEIDAFHRRYPFIDLAVHGAGERAFAEILAARPRWPMGVAAVASSFLERAAALSSRPPGVQRFKDLTEVPEPLSRGHLRCRSSPSTPKLDWIGIEETNRNCPFQCTFCGWGLLGVEADHAAPRRKCCATIDWFADHSIGYVFVVDSNFGMFKERDIEIARYFARTSRSERGYPRSVNVAGRARTSSSG